MQPEKKTQFSNKIKIQITFINVHYYPAELENVETCEIKQYNWLQIINRGAVLSSTAT